MSKRSISYGNGLTDQAVFADNRRIQLNLDLDDLAAAKSVEVFPSTTTLLASMPSGAVPMGTLATSTGAKGARCGIKVFVSVSTFPRMWLAPC